jgi:hypothetical protein
MSPLARFRLVSALVAASLATPAAAQTKPILCGETVHRVLAETVAVDEVGFDARANEVVSITAVADLASGSEVYWSLVDPNGMFVWTSGFLGLVCHGQCETVPLPATGRYTIQVYPALGPIEYDLTLEAVSETANGLPNGPPSPTCARGLDGTRVIDEGKPQDGDIAAAGDTDTFTLVAKEGEVLLIAIDPTTGNMEENGGVFDPQWELFDRAGVPVRLDGRASNACNKECETIPLSSTGTFTIKVSDTRLNAAGKYTISFKRGAPPTTTTTTTSTTTTSLDPGTTTSTTGTTTSTTETTLETTTTTLVTTTTTVEETTSTTTTVEPTTSTTTTDTTSTTLASTTTTTATTTSPTTTDTTSTTLDSTTTTTTTTTTDTTTSTTTIATTTTTVQATTSTTGAATTSTTSTVPPTSTTVTTTTASSTTTVTTRLPGPPPLYELSLALRPTRSLSSVPEEMGAALAGTGTRFLIGAPHDGTRGPDSGAVYEVSVEAASFGVLVRTLFRPGPPAAATWFGAAVAPAASGVLVGAPGDDSAGTDAGAAYLFADAGGDAVTLLPTPAVAGAAFGAAVAAVGADVAVGAPAPGASRCSRRREPRG